MKIILNSPFLSLIAKAILLLLIISACDSKVGSASEEKSKENNKIETDNSADSLNYLAKKYIDSSPINWLKINPKIDLIQQIDKEKPIFIYWRVEWVNFSQTLERQLLHTEAALKHLEENFNLIAVECFTDNEILIDGKVYKMGSPFHEFQAKFIENPVYPSFYILDKQLNLVNAYINPDEWWGYFEENAASID